MKTGLPSTGGLKPSLNLKKKIKSPEGRKDRKA
jgi:hypothetical protein